MNLADLRKDYSLEKLDVENAPENPLTLFKQWLQAAINAEALEPTAVCLSTANAEGRPSGRMVLLKGVDERGFLFYTNYESRKGNDLKANACAALTFFWPELERQVRIEGRVEKLSAEESFDYYKSRPRESQIGAWASPQSRPLTQPFELETRLVDYLQKFGDDEIPLPPHWGGYVLRPDSIEFWQGRPSRLHDRLHYSLTNENRWLKERLAP